MSKTGRANKSTFPGRYTGELATPIYEPVAGVVGGLGGGKAEAERRAFEQRVLKMEKLFVWYSIDPDEPDAGMCLAAKLALAHVPGMQVRHELRKLRGRKRSWKDGLGIELVRDVDALQQTKRMNYEQAIGSFERMRRSRGGTTRFPTSSLATEKHARWNKVVGASPNNSRRRQSRKPWGRCSGWVSPTKIQAIKISRRRKSSARFLCRPRTDTLQLSMSLIMDNNGERKC